MPIVNVYNASGGRVTLYAQSAPGFYAAAIENAYSASSRDTVNVSALSWSAADRGTYCKATQISHNGSTVVAGIYCFSSASMRRSGSEYDFRLRTRELQRRVPPVSEGAGTVRPGMSLRTDAPTSFVLYGPFPVYWLRVLSGTLVLLVAWGLFSLSFERAELACERSSPNVGRCELTRGFPGFVRHMEIPLVRVVGVRVGHETTPAKGGSVTHWGVPYLELHDATPMRLMRVSPDAARAFSSAIETGLHGRSRAFGATLRGPLWALLASIVPLALGIAFLRSGLRGFGRIHFEIDDGAKTLTAKRLVLGVPVSTHIVSLDDVRDVGISWTYEKDHFSETGTERAGTLNLIDSAYGERPVTSTSFRGFQVHLRAATALRTRLGASPERGPLELELEEAEKPVSHPWGSTIPGKLGAVLLGAGWGSIFGVMILWSAYVLFRDVRGHESGGLGSIGAGALGAAGGVALALHLVRSRPPR